MATFSPELLAFLQGVEDLKDVSEDDLRWLIEQADIWEIKKGEMFFERGMPADYLYLILEGRTRIWFEQGGENREVARTEPGDITGVLPYSRLTHSTGFAAALTDGRILRLHRERFPEMIREHHSLTAAFVHNMTNRVRSFTTRQQQNEKLISLGKLSAGLAHELNNPAAAVVRSAEELQSHLAYLPGGFKKVISIRMEEEQVDAVNNLLFSRLEKLRGQSGKGISLLERTQLEDDITDWFDDAEIEPGPEWVDTLVEFGFGEDDLEFILEQTSDTYFPPVINWVVNVLTTERLVSEIQEASKRIADLVGSIKSYSHMDRDADRQMVDIHEGIRNTATILKHKMKKNKVHWVEDFSSEVPRIAGFPGELNQVWTNLMDNALDAMEETGGTLTVRTHMDGVCVAVKVSDTGSGIPEEVQNRIFDPFFTTKPMGKGTGVGLDVVHKILTQHKADIEVASQPGNTVFTMLFPTGT
ncbi:MAG: ATP-binding protein [Bacteroidota bacterium]